MFMLYFRYRCKTRKRKNGIESFLYTNEKGSGFIKQTKEQSKRKTTYLDHFITPCTDPSLK